mmetsp:Transcript_23254/g.49739  ORF Transcript_23254/g.49739 Transcript_23254/m.49739 type:complete len:100 (+) Transcript_23254:833-1132(+)
MGQAKELSPLRLSKTAISPLATRPPSASQTSPALQMLEPQSVVRPTDSTDSNSVQNVIAADHVVFDLGNPPDVPTDSGFFSPPIAEHSRRFQAMSISSP